MTKAYWTITPRGLEPEDDSAKQWHETARKNGRTLCQVQQPSLPRNPGHHRKFFALVNLVYENLPHEGDAESFTRYLTTTESLVSYLKIATGHCDFIWARNTHGSPVQCQLPRSISFAKMDQAEFETFFNKCCDVIIRDFWPDMDKETLKAEVAEMCGAGGFNEIGRMPDAPS